MRQIVKAGESSLLKDHQNKAFVHQSPRPLNTDTFFTGTDDNGNRLEIVHTIGESKSQIVYADFLTEYNQTYLHQALCQWLGTHRDTISCIIVPDLTPCTPGVNTNWYKLPNGVIVASAGTGNIVVDPTQVLPVEMAPDQDTGLRAPGYWSIELKDDRTGWDYSTLQFKPDGSGIYNLFSEELDIAEFVRKLPLLGSSTSWNILPSADTARIAPGMRLKLVFETVGLDHGWECCISFVMHREKV